MSTTLDFEACALDRRVPPASAGERSLQHWTDALRRLVEQIEHEPSLAEPNGLRHRLKTLDRFDSYFPYAPQETIGPETVEPSLLRRAKAICARLEALNCELYEAIRFEIQSGYQPDTLLQWFHPSLDIADRY